MKPRSTTDQPGAVEQYATFYVGDALLGVPIQQIEEINRHVAVTPVPHAPGHVRGVINLRGEVVTVVDLRTMLGLEDGEVGRQARNVIVSFGGEHVGMLVDRVGDVVAAQSSELLPAPANVSGVEGRFFRGVYRLEAELLVILDVDELLSSNQTA